ncbi:RsmB/NOP family class I SAM-dependent RNA methyltransferase [bacterium]|nr:MAG: RsmB/NOP family class I SAM-dependent RNA methyltransferase [bacterium]
MKLHRNLALAVIGALQAIFEEKQVASRALDKLFVQNPKWGKRDRAFVAETTYEIVRWARRLSHAVGSSENWALLAAQLVRSGVELPDWEEFAPYNAATIQAGLDEEVPRAVRESIPDWLDEMGAAQLGARWDAEISALNAEAPVVLRVNTLKLSRAELQKQLADEGIETTPVPNLPDALQMETRRSIAHLPLYRDGYFEFQDAASQLVAPFLRLQSGMKVLDACAGAGGKSLHIAALMRNRGHIVSSDTEKEKLGELRRRSSRAGISCLETKTPQTLLSHDQIFERILIDAPCSGLGTLRRQPDLKWRLTPEFLEQLQTTQQEILRHYVPMLQSGGFLVYATCSVLPAENERQIEWLLKQNLGLHLDESRSVSSATTGFDGFFMARLKMR